MIFPRLYFLQEDEQLFVRAFTRRWVINGPRRYVTQPLWRAVRRKAITLGPTDYVMVRNTLTGELRNAVGPKLFFLGAEDEIVQQQEALALKHNQYARLFDQNSGKIRVERGEKTVYLAPTEKLLGEVQTGINIDEQTAVLVRDTSTGQLALIRDKQVFVPSAHEEIVEVRKRIRLEDNEAIIIKDITGKYVIRRGADAERAFFLGPYDELLELRWSTGIHKDRMDLRISKFDLRPKFMWYEFEARTQDNVELVIGITFFWEIVDLERMINTTNDTPGDLCSHARSAILQAISKVSLEQFLAGFNQVIHGAIFDDATEFYTERGVKLHAVEVRSVASKDARTQQVLQEIINETTNRINRLQKQESENEVKLKQLYGEIETEQRRGQLLELRRQHAQTEGTIAGEAEALRINAFLLGLGDLLTTAEKLAIFNTLRKQDALTALSQGKAQLYFTPADVDLTIRSG